MTATSLLAGSAAVVGKLSTYMPGSWFSHFLTETMAGMCLVRGRRIDFLALIAHRPGQGDCGRFLAECMEHYDTIGVWELLNTDLEAMLARRGFVPADEPFQGEMTAGMRWDRR